MMDALVTTQKTQPSNCGEQTFKKKMRPCEKVDIQNEIMKIETSNNDQGHIE